MSSRQHDDNSISERPLTGRTPSSGRSPGGLRVIKGGGQRRPDEPLVSRDAVARVLMEAGVDLLLRRITPARAEEIERKVDRVLDLFDRVDAAPLLMPVLQRHLDELEALMRETRQVRAPARRGG
ncbi:hypothetical protein F0U60_35325 [Archangium minus]|uniref:Uncharacterized protein n=1 Tax=Archangium minus TaxID=83450 RepID=A0ABY9XBH6_9BACT|nr:hypothetical protein F0U61_35220 [Archangium violaceum]WNG52761.1 hypothetical protein F0U60_35325 [Archangium minus]